jgi:F0F1-type ATP synthase membrane subunit b/b'
MSAKVIFWIVFISLFVISIALNVFFVWFVVRKRQSKIIEYNDKILKAEELKKELDKKGAKINEEIKKASNTSDYIRILNSL